MNSKRLIPESRSNSSIAWSSSRDQLLREAAIGRGPDVVHSAFVWVEEFAQSGALKPINELEQYSPFENGFDDFVATDLTYHDGKAYGVPWTADTWSMVYNNNVLKEAGIEIKPRTWEEVLEVSRKIKKETGKIGFSFPRSLSTITSGRMEQLLLMMMGMVDSR